MPSALVNVDSRDGFARIDSVEYHLKRNHESCFPSTTGEFLIDRCQNQSADRPVKVTVVK